MNECSSCSAGLRPEMKFCPSCGTAIANRQPPESDIEQPSIDSPDQTETKPSRAPNEQTDKGAADRVPLEEDSLFTKNQKIGAAVAAVLAVIGLLTFQGINTANESAEKERLVKRANLVASACAEIIGDHVPDIAGAEVVFHRQSIEEVEVKFVDSGGSKLGNHANCDYSVDGTKLRVESIEWARNIDDRNTDITYDRTSGLVTFAKESLAPVASANASEGSATGCQQAFRIAAAVPLSQDNNDEIRETTMACRDVDEWWEMLKKYPDVFGVTYFLESEKGLYVGSACLVGGSSPVCRDADARGIGF